MRSGPAAGFTLLEILVALVVLGLLIGGLAQGSRFGLAALDRTSHRVAVMGELEAMERGARAAISQMAPAREGGPPPLRGTATTMAFFGAIAGIDGDLGPSTPMALGVDRLRRLVLREASGRETVLLEDIDRLELAYWRGAWVTRWEAAALPQLVRVRIVFPHGDPRHWPDILVAPRREPAAT